MNQLPKIKVMKHTPGPWISYNNHVNEHSVTVYQIDQEDGAPTLDGKNPAICIAEVLR